MAGDDDIAASLPRPPLPAPARRDAAIAEALRRFDGAPSAQAGDGRPARAASWWSGPRRPYAGALAGAFLVTLIGLPFVWTSFDNYAADGDRDRPPGVAAPAREPVMAEADMSMADAAAPEPEADPSAPAPAVEAPKDAPAPPSPADPAAALAREAAPDGANQEPAADFAASKDSAIVVTGSRVRRPNLEATVPATSIGGEAITVTGSRSPNSKAARRGDWNACTIEDPGRSLERCRNSVGTVARGARGRAGAQLADGLSRAWTGDIDGAMAAFDRAVELAPRSSSAYLNRGLAWRRRGDLDRALADLDRAVRHAPRDARAYYHRSLVLRQRGDLRRARADEESAVALDQRYAPLVKGGSTR